nr:MAG TPA: hypothetical protein [Caudoviricetes sp.]
MRLRARGHNPSVSLWLTAPLAQGSLEQGATSQ